MHHDYDFVIIGSGFGGSVSALRLVEKGYRVVVVEQGRRWSADNLPKTTWSLSRWLWRPALGLNGFFSMQFFRHVVVLHGTPSVAAPSPMAIPCWCRLPRSGHRAAGPV